MRFLGWLVVGCLVGGVPSCALAQIDGAVIELKTDLDEVRYDRRDLDLDQLETIRFLKWESVRFDVTASRNAAPLDLSGDGVFVRWDVYAEQGSTNAAIQKIGEVVDASGGQVRVWLEPTEAGLPEGEYYSYLTAFQIVDGQTNYVNQLAYNRLVVEWAPNFNGYTYAGPYNSSQLADYYKSAQVDALIAAIPPDTDTQLTETQVDAFADNNGYAANTDLSDEIAARAAADDALAGDLSAVRVNIVSAYGAHNDVIVGIASATAGSDVIGVRDDFSIDPTGMTLQLTKLVNPDRFVLSKIIEWVDGNHVRIDSPATFSITNGELLVGLDSSSAINQAIADLPDGGGTIFIPRGRYLLTNAIVIARRGIHIQGAGKEATALFIYGTTHHGIDFDTPKTGEDLNRSCVISDLGITGCGGDLHTGCAINVANDDDSFFMVEPTICRVVIRKCGTGIRCANTPLFAVSYSQVSGCKTAVDLTKSDSFSIKNCSIGGNNVFPVSNSLGFNIVNSTGSPTGPNFCGTIDILESGNFYKFMNIKAGRLNVRNVNYEQCSGDTVISIDGESIVSFDHIKFLGNGVNQTGNGCALFRTNMNRGHPYIPRVEINNIFVSNFTGWIGYHVYGDENYLFSPICLGGSSIDLLKTSTSSTTDKVLLDTYARSQGITRSTVGAYGEHDLNSRGKIMQVQSSEGVSAPDRVVYCGLNRSGDMAARNMVNDMLEVHIASSCEYNGVKNIGGSATNVFTATIPSMPENGSSVTLRASGIFADNTNIKRIRVYFRSTGYIVFDSGAGSYAGSEWSLDCVLTCIGEYRILADARWLSTDPLKPTSVNVAALGTNVTEPNPLGIEFTGVEDGDVVLRAARVISMEK